MGHENRDKTELNSHEMVKMFFEGKGWAAAAGKMNSNGVDLVAIKDDKYEIIEVKKAFRRTDGRWVVTAISDHAQAACTMVAILLPGGHVWVERMNSYLEGATSDTSKYVTHLVDIYG